MLLTRLYKNLHATLVEIAAVIGGILAIMILVALLTVGVRRWISSAGSANTGEQLIAAAMAGDPLAVAKALDRGAPPDSRDCGGDTALMWAARSGDETSVLELIRAGANVSAVNNHELTALQAATTASRIGTARVLLEHGANPNIQSALSGTPLCQAVAWSNIELVNLLLQHGADPNLPWPDGTTPLALSKSLSYDDEAAQIKRQLLSAGAREPRTSQFSFRSDTPPATF